MELKHRKYKISGAERKREDAKKDTEKNISASSFNNLYWYHNENRNMTSRTKDATMMLYHNLKNTDDNRKVKQVIKKQEFNQYKNTFYQKVQKTAKDLH